MTRDEVFTSLVQKFTSGNSTQVGQATITRDEFNALFIALRDCGHNTAALAAKDAELQALRERVEALADEFRHTMPIEVLQAWGKDFRAALGDEK